MKAQLSVSRIGKDLSVASAVVSLRLAVKTQVNNIGYCFAF